jgi:hypothetical protein
MRAASFGSFLSAQTDTFIPTAIACTSPASSIFVWSLTMLNYLAVVHRAV